MTEIMNVKKGFAINGGRVEVLKGINLSLPDDAITVIVGRSGCGKTTLLKLIAGLDTPDAGEIKLKDGIKTGMVFQEARLMPWLTCEKNIAFGLHRRPDRQAIANLIDLVGLRGFEKAYPAQLSGGMRQRAALARTLATDASLVLMDEPFAALDYFTRAQMQKELLRIRAQSGMGVILVTHNIDEALTLADRLVLISSGVATREYDLTAHGAERDILSPAFIEIKKDILATMEGTPA